MEKLCGVQYQQRNQVNHKVTDAVLDLASELEVVFKQALDTHLRWRKQALEQNRLAVLQILWDELLSS
jgi:copper homeostasis protein CutC